MKKIAIYGGTFNPIHKGHVLISEFAMKELDIDELYFVPSYKSPFKKNASYVSGKDRIHMINLVKKDNMHISEFEINRKGTSYTIETIKYFKQKFPNDELYLFMGSDHTAKLHKWKNIEEISNMAQIIIFERGDISPYKINVKKYNCKIIKNDKFEYSSSEFKKCNFSVVEEQVMNYIGENNLYREQILKHALDAKRHKHSLATAKLAVSIAKSLGYNAKFAYEAGLYHDITKILTEEEHVAILEQYGFDSNIQKNLMHQSTGKIWLKELYKYNNQEVLDAIGCHTSLRHNMTILDKILYAADKLSDGRKFEGIQELRKIIHTDFEKGFKDLIKINIEQLKTKGISISEDQMKIYEEAVE